MLDIFLIYPSPEGSREIAVREGKNTFGRGSEADTRFADDGLSRVHASVYRDGERVWIVDENSTNGTFINGVKAAGGGTPLKNGDTIKIGNSTSLRVKITSRETPKAAANAKTSPAERRAAPNGSAVFSYLPVILIAGALFVVVISAAFIGLTIFGGERNVVVKNADADEDYPADDSFADNTAANSSAGNFSAAKSPMPKADNAAANAEFTESPTASGGGSSAAIQPGGKKYLEMSDDERRRYLEIKAMRVAQIIGNNSSEKIPPEAVDKIKNFADAYASRIKVKPLGGCRFGDNLQATFERAGKNAPFINRAFNVKGIDPRIGLYLAMIESEHCVCLQSPTGPLGMFQFTFATAKLHFEPSEGVRKGASPANPDDRCFPEPAARAAASYMKALTGRYGTGPSSVPLAIGSYNSGEGGLSTNLQKALESGSGLPRDFWTLISKGEMLSKQFQSENFKYVPKFFAAAIIGENPQDFGLNLQPISTYTK